MASDLAAVGSASIVVRHETPRSAHCGQELPQSGSAGRPRRFCGARFRTAGYQCRRQDLRQDLPRQLAQGRGPDDEWLVAGNQLSQPSPVR